jgi:serine/threonine-protein kinase
MSDPITRLNAALEGRYRIERELGEGGMATVYLADDIRHERRVAVKVLKPELAAVVGADRFLAEIKTTANLQHPHILPLFDSGEADSFLFYVMPYIDGETLRERLDREKPLPIDEALGIATAVANALQTAHDAGIVHRDIKPGNILMSRGEPLVADFGIALAVGSAGGNRLTETGLSVGTPYYMSPEQATGDQAIGPASDTFALACVLYEMLVGEPPYPGTTAQAVLGKIIQGVPVSATAVRRSIPANVDAAIRKALEKLPADRFTGAHSFAKALSDPTFRHGAVVGSGEGEGSGKWRRIAQVALSACAVLIASTLWLALRPAPSQPLARYMVELPADHNPARAYGDNLTISPDGSAIVYTGVGPQGSQLWIKRRDQLQPTAINGTEGGYSPSFSPEGQRIAFLTGGGVVLLKVVSLGGEPPLTLLDEGLGGNDVAWGPDGNIYTDGGAFGIGRVPATGGELEILTELDLEKSEGFHEWYDPLPNGRGVLFTAAYSPASNAEEYTINVLDLESGASRVLLQGVFARYAPSGHLVYVTANGTLLAAPFDQDRLELTGPAVALAEGVGVGPFGSADLAIAADGTLIYMAGAASTGLSRVVWVDRMGEVTPVDEGWEFDPGQPEVALALSPDDRRLAVKINTEAGEDIWIKQLDDGPLSRLTFHEGIDRRPRWSEDGTRVLFNSDRDSPDTPGTHYDLWIQPADGTGSPELLLDLEESILEVQRTPDESAFILRLRGLSGATDVRDIVSLKAGETETTPLAAEPYDEKAVALSSSGRWIAYESTETGRDEIYVRPYPNADDGKWQISTGGGINPKWAHSEEEIFFVGSDGQMMVADVQAEGGTFRVGQRRPLFSVFDRILDSGANYASWDVSSDDQRFIMVQHGAGDPEGADLILVQNFFDDLRARVGEGG